MDNKKSICIAGAGLVGSMLAFVLKKEGHQVSLFEKRSDLRGDCAEAGKSINLIITAKGIKTLRDAGIFEDVEKMTTPVFGRMMHSLDEELTFQPYGRDESEYNLSISRKELNRILLDKAQSIGVDIYFEEELQSIDFDSKKANFSQTKDISYDVFFGADGAGSNTRSEMKKKWGDHMDDSMSSLGVKYKELFMPADSEGNYAMDAKSLHIWPRGNHMLMALPNQDGSFTMTLYIPDSEVGKLDCESSALKYFSENYQEVIAFMPDYKKELLENPLGFLGTLRCKPWTYKGEVCLVGDAAHAIVPFFGQGMNTGFSDISFLIKKLGENSYNWVKTFDEYSEFQKDNGDAVADLSIQNYQVMSEKVADQKFLLRKEVEHLLENKFPETFRSQYGQVTYTLIPYQFTAKAAVIQNRILDILCEGIVESSQVDLCQADRLICEELLPFYLENSLSIERYQ